MAVGALTRLIALVVALVLAGCGSHNSREMRTAVSSDAASKQRVAGWPDRWCGLPTGSSMADVRSTMGPPTSVFAGQDEWEGYGYSFTAFYDETDHVRQLDYSGLRLSSYQRAKLTCEDTR